jgi:hypothetical protein
MRPLVDPISPGVVSSRLAHREQSSYEGESNARRNLEHRRVGGATGLLRQAWPGGESSLEPDVLLDVPQLRVEEIILEVEDLRAHVSVQAEVLNLLRLSVGADVQLGGVHLEIKVWKPKRS